MSRIGNKEIIVPAGVEVKIENNFVTVKGSHGTLERQFSDLITIEQEPGKIVIKRSGNTDPEKKIHGTTRALLANMVHGVHTKFKKELEINGVGYRAQLQGKTLVVNAGYSHNFEFEIPQGVTVTVPKNTQIIIEGIDKQVVGELAANIREVRKPEPYKGKGIRYIDEHVRRKEGKTAAK
ncbi:MAG: 50S ribosomal protein L6 [Acholeplasmataceae bacterium]|nr:50S ribosomal protein L6 [Acholeplasmataceae bacterium]